MNKFFLPFMVAVAVSANVEASPIAVLMHSIGIPPATSSARSNEVPAKGKIEVAFSPNEGSEELVIRAIKSVQQNANGEILILSYSFTSANITKALLDMRRKGVTIRLVADYKNNISQNSSGKAKAALSALKEAGADVRTIKVFPIHHDKVIIVDRKTVELGSFNFSYDAAHKNSENVFVNWNNPDLAAVYFKHFKRNYDLSDSYPAQF